MVGMHLLSCVLSLLFASHPGSQDKSKGRKGKKSTLQVGSPHHPPHKRMGEKEKEMEMRKEMNELREKYDDQTAADMLLQDMTRSGNQPKKARRK